MNRTVKITAIVLTAFVVLSSKLVWAELVTIEVEGVVAEVTTYGGMTLDGSVTVGSIMTGSCTYDTETPDQAFATSSIGLYSLISVSMDIGSYIFTHNPTAAEEPFFWISVGSGGFYYDVVSPSPLFYGPCWINGEPHNLENLDLSGTVINLMYLAADTKSPIGDALPDADSFPDLSVFNETIFRVAIDSSPNFEISGEVTSITAIPEPTTILLFGLGGLALLRNRRK